MAQQPSGGGETNPESGLVWLALLLAFLGIALRLYQPVMNGDFVSDDLQVVVTNPYVQELSVENVLEILHPYAPPVAYAMNYSPVHLLAHAVEVHFFGSDTYGFHVVNVLIHVITSLLLVVLLRTARLAWPIAAAAGAFFLVHPANVEAVAMVFQLKTTLATALSFGAFLLFLRHPLMSTLLFGLAILTKFTAVTALPVVCAIYWIRGSELPAEDRPHLGWLVAWAAVLVAVAIPEFKAFQSAGQGVGMDPLVHTRTIVAIAMRYLLMAASSYGVAPLHSVAPVGSWLDPWWLAGLLALGLLAWRAGLAVYRREEEAIWWVMAAGAYAPISQVFPFIYPMADRYLYPVLPGLLGGTLLAFRAPADRALGWARTRMGSRAAHLPLSQIAQVAVLLLFSLAFIPQSHAHSRIFQTSAQLSAESVRVYPNGIQANGVRAIEAAQRGDAAAAAEALRLLHQQGYNDFAELRPRLGPVGSDPRVAAVLGDMAQTFLDLHVPLEDLYPLEQYAVSRALIELGRLSEAIEVLEDAVAANGPTQQALRILLEQTRALEKRRSTS